MSVEPLREVRDHFSDVVDRVEHEHERVTVTRNGRAAAVIMSPDDLAELGETLAVLSDPDALADIREADAAYKSGDVVRGVDAVRSLRSRPSPTTWFGLHRRSGPCSHDCRKSWRQPSSSSSPAPCWTTPPGRQAAAR